MEKLERYEELLQEVAALVDGEPDLICKLANVSAAIKSKFGFFWVGFYIKRGEELVLGPFQGQVACTRIHPEKGVCGKAYSTKKTVIVPNVEEFPGYIACHPEPKSEIVVPHLAENQEVNFVLDIDSEQINDFDEVDRENLEKLIALI